MAETDVIRTPDQRLRVFVSSTLTELAAEREAARDAVTASNRAPGEGCSRQLLLTRPA